MIKNISSSSSKYKWDCFKYEVTLSSKKIYREFNKPSACSKGDALLWQENHEWYELLSLFSFCVWLALIHIYGRLLSRQQQSTGCTQTHTALYLTIADMEQATFSNAFSWMMIFVFWFKFHDELFLNVQKMTNQLWLAPNRRQVIVCTNYHVKQNATKCKECKNPRGYLRIGRMVRK